MSTSIPIPSKTQSSDMNISQTPGGTILKVAQTPGGTFYGTTPGGTKRVLDKQKLLALRNSPLSKTPPVNLPKIYGMTPNLSKPIETVAPVATKEQHNSDEDGDDIFEMDK